MRDLLLFSVLFASVLGCDISRFVNKGTSNNGAAANASPTAEIKQSPLVSETPKPTPTGASLIPFLKKSVGKYPYEIKLMNNPELKSRLKKLLGKDYAAMDENFDVQAPIEVIGDVLMTTGCEAHNCGANQYLLFVDLKGDNINVYHITDDETKHYFEHGEIQLPKKFADQITSDQ